MRIGIEATSWQNKRGYGRHARALFGTLIEMDQVNEYTLFLDSRAGWEALPPQAARRLARTGVPTAVAAAADGHRSLSDMWQVSRTLSQADCDLLIFPTVYSYVPVFSRVPKIVMIHDVIAETYPDLTLPTPLARLFWRTKVALGRWQAAAIVTVSDFSRRGIVEHFGTPPQQIHVVGEASDPVFRRLDAPALTPHLRGLGLIPAQRMVIYVGGFGPHKNLENLVAAFAHLVTGPDAAEYADVRLVMVGEYKKEVFLSYYSTLQQQIENLDITDKVVFTGFLPDKDLVNLLNLAAVLVLPSLMEGFGLPAVEAAACGCPVIATTSSPLPDLLGAGGVFIDPQQPAELQAALSRVLGSATLRQTMIEAGLAAAQALTWEAAAQQMRDVINHVVANNGNARFAVKA